MPTIAESGCPASITTCGWACSAGGTPADIVDKINEDVTRALATPEIKERLADLGAEPMPMTPAEFKQFAHDEMDVGARIVKAAGVKGQ